MSGAGSRREEGSEAPTKLLPPTLPHLLTHILTYALTRFRTCYALEAAHSLRSYVLRATHRDDDDVARVVACCLRHRLRKDPLEQVDSGDRVVKVFCQVFGLNPDDREAFQLALAA